MNFWANIKGLFKRESDKDVTPSTHREGATSLLYSPNQSSLAVATVFRCVKLLSESIANLPVQYLKREKGIFVDASNAQLDYLLNVQPDYAMNAFDHWRQVGIELLLEGNAYIVPIYNPASMALYRLALCGRGTVMHDTINDVYTVNDFSNGISGTYREDEIIHIKGLTLNNHKHGVSVLTYARLALDIASAGDKETRNRFANGGTVKGLVSNDNSVKGFGEYQDKQLEATAKDLNYRYNIVGENIVASPGQVGFTQISLSSVDMQFLESRKFTVREICRFFGVHPSFVFDDSSNNYKSAEQATVAFLNNTLNPLLRNIEVELRRKLIAPELAGKFLFQFDRKGLYASDLSGMMDYRIKLLQTGASVNEVRKLENLPPVKGGDVALVSANLKSANEYSQQTTFGNEQ